MDAVGPISLTLELARKQLTECVSYQAFLGVNGSAAAKAKTYLAGLPPTANEYSLTEWESTLRPFGIIYQATHAGYTLTRSATFSFSESGRFFIELETSIPRAYQPLITDTPIDMTVDIEAGDRWILNQIGQIAAEYVYLAGTPGYLGVNSLSVAMGPSRERYAEQPACGEYYWTLLEVNWGAG